MKNFNPLTFYSQDELSQALNESAQSIGGKNYFLLLLEAVRDAQPHPLLAKNAEFKFSVGSVKWSKPIFREKFTLFKHLRLNNKDGNIYLGISSYLEFPNDVSNPFEDFTENYKKYRYKKNSQKIR